MATSLITFPIDSDVEGVIIREYTEADFDACKHLFQHTQSLYGNPDIYVQMSLMTDMKDIRRNYLELTDADVCLPTSVDDGAQPKTVSSAEKAKRKGTWLVAVDTLNNNIVCGQVSLHPLVVGDANAYKHYSNTLAQTALLLSDAEKAPKEEAPFPYTKMVGAHQVGELRRMAVLPEYQAKRIGATLLKAFMRAAKELFDYRLIHLTTLMSMDKAVAFYGRQGFVAERVERLQMGVREEATAAVTEEDPRARYLPAIVDKREIIGGVEALTPSELKESTMSPSESSVLYVIHFWKEL